MARRPRSGGAAVFRRAVIADMTRTQATFPTTGGAQALADVTAGRPVEVSSGRLFRGLHMLGDARTADLFRATGRGERWFLLDIDNTLTDQA